MTTTSSSTRPPETPDDAGAAADPADPAASLRLQLLGAGGPEAVISDAPPKRRIPPQVLLLGLLFLAAAGLLYAMRIFGMGPLRQTDAQPIELPPDAKPAAVSADQARLIHDLDGSRVAVQVPVDQVQRNPFKLADGLSHAESEGDKPEPDPSRGIIEKRQAAIASALANLTVTAILGGSSPVARVGDQTVRVGDSVADVLTVSAIRVREVDLTADGKTYTLTLGDSKSLAPKPRRR